jgi:glyoxalase family protein
MLMITGIHHVTALASTPQANVDFYVGVLGLRLIKKTVNFDDPGTYHLYYGDGIGSPGTLMTFFPYGHILPGKRGTGETASVTFQVPSGSLDWWCERLATAGHETGEEQIFGNRVIWGLDPDGLRVEFEEADTLADFTYWENSDVPLERAIRTISRVTLTPNPGQTEEFVASLLGFQKLGSQDERTRFVVGDSFVDIVDSTMPRAQSSAGTIHHVAFRNPNDEQQEEWLKKLVAAGRNASPVMDRNYFNSIYFREPGGVLFEFATDGPGFSVDEPLDALGEQLMLPVQYESKREQLLAILPELRLP